MTVKSKMEKVRNSIDKRKGRCIICGDRVHKSEDHIKSADGYCHKQCLAARKTDAVARA